mgnify:CR=1 FL=1
MTTTLVEELKLIETNPYLLNKEVAIKRVLDEARHKHPTVDKAAKGEISFTDIVEKLYEKYKGWRLLLPRFKDEEYDKLIDEELHNLFQADFFRTEVPERVYKRIPYLGGVGGWIYDKLTNPITLPLFVGGFAALISGGQGKYESEIANYANWFSIGAFAGLVLGFMGSMMRHSEMYVAKAQARYLHEIIKEYIAQNKLS